MKRMRLTLSLGAVGALAAALVNPGIAVHATSNHVALKCDEKVVCPDVQNSREVFGANYYVGHDEPSLLFYSDQPGSGNKMTYRLRLPKDPPSSVVPGRAWNFQLHPAIWFGMALCDTQSYPEQVSTCTADSDTNITNDLAQRPGNGFMELQFYPPGGAPQPVFFSCDPKQWCVAMVTFGLSEDPVNGTLLNPTCANITGIEYANFAYLTKSGVPQPNSPPNPVQSTLQTFTVNKNVDLMMNSGDQLAIDLHDTGSGLSIQVSDQTTGSAGSMTASAANGFGSPRFAPTGTSCDLVPMDFHPMYSTSSEQTRVIWAAHSYNIAFSDEIGHFDYCSLVAGNTAVGAGKCATSATEGSAGDLERTDVDDNFCFKASQSTLIQVSGCEGTNTGFDAVSYQKVWPDGNTDLHPEPVIFSSPLTSGQNYQRLAFEADLPRIEFNTCNRNTGDGCFLIPITDDNQPATFYPFFTAAQTSSTCNWVWGNNVPGLSTTDFGQNNQFGSLLSLTYLRFGGGGDTIERFNDFRQVLDSNPCPAA